MVERGTQQKGSSIRSILHALERLHGDQALAAVKARMPAALRAELEPSILPIRFYPVEIAASIHVGVKDVLGGGTWDLSHGLGVEAANIDFGSVHRVILRAVQYDTIFDRMEMTWRHLISRGEFEWHERRPGYTSVTIGDVPGFNRGNWNATAGRAEQLLRLTGAKVASMQAVRVTATSCTFEAIWVE